MLTWEKRVQNNVKHSFLIDDLLLTYEQFTFTLTQLNQ